MRDLEVEGEIPAEIDGAFFRAVPDNAHAPMFEDDVALNADGMIARFNIEGGAVDFDIRYVETERYLAEKQARRALFGRYRNPFTDDPIGRGRRPHRLQHHPGLARRPAVHDQGGRPRLRDQPAHARDRGQVGLLRRAQVRDLHRPPARRSGHRRAVLLRLRGGRAVQPRHRLRDRRRRGQPGLRAVVRAALLRDDPRLRDHREVRDLADLPDHRRPRPAQGRRRALGAPAGARDPGSRSCRATARSRR